MLPNLCFWIAAGRTEAVEIPAGKDDPLDFLLAATHSPGSFQLSQPLGSSLCLIHVGNEVIAEIKARACHHGTNLQATVRKDCAGGRSAGVVKD